MNTILILGARGFLGSRIAASLERMEHITVKKASSSARDGYIKCDLRDPEDFTQFEDVDLIINCADALVADPWPAMAHCLEHGQLWLETTSEPMLVRRVLAVHHQDTWTGAVVLGAGIFTGYSNMMGARSVEHLSEQQESATRLDLGIRWSPLSAGGAGMVALMTHLLNVPTAYLKDGQSHQTMDVTAGPALPYDDGPHKGLHIPFSEPTMLAHSTNAATIHTYASLTPKLIFWAFLFTPAFLLRLKPVQWVMAIQMTFLRRVLLKSVETPVRMVARAKTATEQVTLQFKAEDGMAFGADAAACQASCLLNTTRQVGVTTLDQCISWATLDDALKKHAQTPWHIDTMTQSTDVSASSVQTNQP